MRYWLRSIALMPLFAMACAGSATAQIPVTAAWDANTDSLTAGYRVSVATSTGPLAVLDVGAATVAVLPLPFGAVYRITVRGYTTEGVEGPPSPEALVDLATAPGAPVGARATVTGATASLTWSPPTSGGVALQYFVSVGTAPGAANLLSDYPVGAALGISGAVSPGTYYARLHAGNAIGIGPPSADVMFQVTDPLEPAPPAGLAATVTGSTVSLRWTAPAGGADSYVLEAGTASGAANVGTLALGATSLTAVAPPGTYYVRVRAVRASRISAPSNEIIVHSR